jgi:hypothetical protein
VLLASGTLPRRIAATPHRIRLAPAFLDQIAIKQPDRHHPLLQRRVRQPGTRVQRHNLRPAPTWTFPQHPDIASNMPPTSNQRINTRLLAHLQVLSQTPAVGIQRSFRQTRISPHPQPLGRTLVPTENRPPIHQHRARLHQHRARHGPLQLRSPQPTP